MNFFNDKELEIYNNPHPQSLEFFEGIEDFETKRLDMYCHSIYMIYFDFLKKHGYNNNGISRDEFIDKFGFHEECLEVLKKACYCDYTHRTLYAVLFDYVAKKEQSDKN